MALTVGCKNQSEGVAPSAPVALTPPASSASSVHMKYGETQIAGGWEVSLDTSDPVETIEMANGWTVEVVYE